MLKLKYMLSLLIVIAAISLPISAISVYALYNDSLIISEPVEESNPGIIDDGNLSSPESSKTEPQFDASENIVDDETFDINASNDDCDIIAVEPYEYEDIDALSDLPDILNRGTITYNLTGGIGGPAPNPAMAVAGINKPLSTIEPTHEPIGLNGRMTDVMFVGWSLTEPSNILGIDDALPAFITTVYVTLNENLNVYAIWGFVTIIIEVDEDGNTTISTPPWIDADYEVSEDNDGNITITFPLGTNEDSITTIVPLGWDYEVEEGENGEVIILAMPPAPIMHDVTFNLNGGTNTGNAGPIVIPISLGSAIGAAVPVPGRANHRFNGWQECDSELILSSSDVSALTIDEPRTFTASWTRNTGGGFPIISPPTEAEKTPDVRHEPPDEPPIEMPPEESPPEEEVPTEEIPQEEIPIEELPEIEQPVIERYEPTVEIQINDTELETEYVEIEDPLVCINDEYVEELDYEEYVEIAEFTVVEFALTNIGNPITGDIRYFRIINRPSSGLQFLSGSIPAFMRGNGIFYTIRYRTNLNNSLRNIASNIPADRPFLLLPPRLRANENITEIIIEFDTVPPGFRVDNIIYRFIVLDENNVTSHWEVMFGESTQKNYLINATLSNIDEISSYENRYDAASWATLQSVISHVQEILHNPNSSLEDLEMAYLMLQQAINELNPVFSTMPFTFAQMFVILFIFMFFIFLIVLLKKLLKYKKQNITKSWKRTLA